MSSSNELKDDVSELQQLGSNETKYKYNKPSVDILETFPNKYHRDYTVRFHFGEFTSLCPKTGQPDFATIFIEYTPGLKCIETKSLKLYLFSYRNHKSFMETITNKIFNDLEDCCDPNYLKVEAKFNIRGGIEMSCVVETEDISEFLNDPSHS